MAWLKMYHHEKVGIEAQLERGQPYGLRQEMIAPDGYAKLIGRFRSGPGRHEDVGLFLRHPFGIGPKFVSWPSIRPGGITPQRFDTAAYSLTDPRTAHLADAFIEAVSPIGSRTVVYVGSPFPSMDPEHAWHLLYPPLIAAGVEAVCFDALTRLDTAFGWTLVDLLARAGIRIMCEPNARKDAPAFDRVKDMACFADWNIFDHAEAWGRLTREEVAPGSVELIERWDWKDDARQTMTPAERSTECARILGLGHTGIVSSLDDMSDAQLNAVLVAGRRQKPAARRR